MTDTVSVIDLTFGETPVEYELKREAREDRPLGVVSAAQAESTAALLPYLLIIIIRLQQTVVYSTQLANSVGQYPAVLHKFFQVWAHLDNALAWASGNPITSIGSTPENILGREQAFFYECASTTPFQPQTAPLHLVNAYLFTQLQLLLAQLPYATYVALQADADLNCCIAIHSAYIIIGELYNLLTGNPNLPTLHLSSFAQAAAIPLIGADSVSSTNSPISAEAGVSASSSVPSVPAIPDPEFEEALKHLAFGLDGNPILLI